MLGSILLISPLRVQAGIFWGGLSEDDQQTYRREASGTLWVEYKAKRRAGEGDERLKPNRTKIEAKAKVLAWKVAGSPPMETELRIDHEDVLFMRKPVGLAVCEDCGYPIPPCWMRVWIPGRPGEWSDWTRHEDFCPCAYDRDVLNVLPDRDGLPCYEIRG